MTVSDAICHPNYLYAKDYWDQMHHTAEGERAVKEQGETYLPKTDGMIKLDTTTSNKVYDAYKRRAVYVNIVEETIEAVLGLIDTKQPQIELPARLEPYFDQITPDGLSVESLVRMVNRSQVQYGRVGLLIDVPDGVAGSQVLPYVSMYSASNILNWNSEFRNGKEMLNFVVLDETDYVFDPVNASWEEQERYRVLLMMNGAYCQYSVTDAGQITANPPEESVVFPSIGGRLLDEIPFVILNARTTTTSIDKPPLMSISNLALAAYRQDADYRAGLYYAGQSTLTATGVQREDIENVVIGAHSLLFSSNPQAKFGYVESAGNSIDASKTAVQDLKAEAIRRGVSLLEQGVESGTALENRMQSKTASINTIVNTGKEGILNLFGIICEWTGLNFDEVVFEPNLDFISDNTAAQDLVALMNAKGLGAPISYESIHAWMKDRQYTYLEYEEEQERIQDELVNFAPPPSPVSPTIEEVEPEQDEA